MNFVFDLADGAWKLVRGIVRPFWRFTRGIVGTLLPGLPRIVQSTVALALVLFELGLVWYVIAEQLNRT